MTETPRPDLFAFLLARIAEDEAVARTASWTGSIDFGGEDALAADQSGISRHIARWDPARVVAECTSKRALLDHHATTDAGECGICADGHKGYCWTVRLLAAPHADHPDYDPAWAATTEESA